MVCLTFPFLLLFSTNKQKKLELLKIYFSAFVSRVQFYKNFFANLGFDFSGMQVKCPNEHLKRGNWGQSISLLLTLACKQMKIKECTLNCP